MIVFCALFQKRPNYAWAFLLFGVLFLFGVIQGNLYLSIVALIISAINWCYYTLISFIGDEKVDAKLMDYDLKNIVPISEIILMVNTLPIAMTWFVTFIPRFPTTTAGTIFTTLVVFNVITIGLGTKFIFSKIILGLANEEITDYKKLPNKIITDLVKILNNP